MPEDTENKLSIQIEVSGAQDAVKALNDVDEAQKRVKKSAEEMQSAQKGKSKGKSSTSSGGGNKKPPAQNGKSPAEKEKDNAEKDAAKSAAITAKSLRATAKGLAVFAAALHIAKKAVDKVSQGFNKGANYFVAGKLTGLGAERIQKWKWALSEYGGGENTASADMLSLQSNLEAAKRGEDPWGIGKRYATGNMLNVTPGMTIEEFIQRIAPRFNELERAQALELGRALGMSDSMSLMLHERGAKVMDWINNLENKEIFSQEEAETSNKGQKAIARSKEYGDRLLVEHLGKLAEWLAQNPHIQQLIGEGGTILDFLRQIAAAVIAYQLFKRFFMFPPGGGMPGGGGGGGGTPVIVPPLTNTEKAPEKEPEKAPEKEPEGAPVSNPETAPVFASEPEKAPEFGDLAKDAAPALGILALFGALSKVFAGETAAQGVLASGATVNPVGLGVMSAFGATVGGPLAAGYAALRHIVGLGEKLGLTKPDIEPKRIDGGEIGNFVPLMVDDRGEEYIPPKEQEFIPLEEFEKQLKEKYPNDNSSITPFNFLDKQQAAEAGRLSVAAMGGGTNVDVGGVNININAPSGDADTIVAAVGQGGEKAREIIRDNFEALDIETAGAYIG